MQTFFDDLAALMYPSSQLHQFGVNGKVSGSVGAIGEMQNVLAVLHGPRGCGFHYRYSARRRHQPFYPLLCSDLTEQEIIQGGIDKLLSVVRGGWERFHPELIFIIPTPVSDILSEDIESAAKLLREEGIPAVSIRSELFSHRDKSYTRKRVREMADQKITGDNRLEMELKGCGFTEALCALVTQVMEPQPLRPYSVNIETVGWGSEGTLALREIAAFLERCGVSVHTWIPSSSVPLLKTAPAAQLNLVKRVRWARMMQDRFKTDYLHLGGAGRYTGLEGVCTFYRDIAEKLGMAEKMEPLILQEEKAALERTYDIRKALSRRSCVLVCRGLQNAPFQIKLYAKDFGLSLRCVCLILTSDMSRDIGLTPALLSKLMSRVQEAADLYAGGVTLLLNPPPQQLRTVFAEADAVVGTDDFTLEGMGAPLIPSMSETMSYSFASYERNLRRLYERMEGRMERKNLILNRMPFDSQHYPLIIERDMLASREMWKRMWLYREEEAR